MVRRRPLLLSPLLLAAGAARARQLPPEVGIEWPQAQLVGQAPLRVWGLHVYDARLWAPRRPTADDWPQRAFALELVYARAFDGVRIADRSIEEMARQGTLAPDQAERWLARLRRDIPDVRAGDRLSGLHEPGRPARLHHNGRRVAEWDDAELVRRFFGIWLAPQTSEPALREALLGGRA
ncbi:MAG: hypothetical protein U1F56_01935 [Rubrivivax sp.]